MPATGATARVGGRHGAFAAAEKQSPAARLTSKRRWLSSTILRRVLNVAHERPEAIPRELLAGLRSRAATSSAAILFLIRANT